MEGSFQMIRPFSFTSTTEELKRPPLLPSETMVHNLPRLQGRKRESWRRLTCILQPKKALTRFTKKKKKKQQLKRKWPLQTECEDWTVKGYLLEAFPPVASHTRQLLSVPLNCLLAGMCFSPCIGSSWWLGSARPQALKAKTMSELSSSVDFCYKVHDKRLPDEGTDSIFCQADVHYLHERFLWLDNIYSPLNLMAINVAK